MARGARRRLAVSGEGGRGTIARREREGEDCEERGVG